MGVGRPASCSPHAAARPVLDFTIAGLGARRIQSGAMTAARIRLTGAQWAGLVSHLADCLPEEGCGLLAGKDRVELVLPIENGEHSAVRYTMEPRALVSAIGRIEASGMDLLGIFHSHPAGPFGVSESDVREWQYPEAVLVVCSRGVAGWAARAFVVAEGRVTEVPLLVDEN